MCIGNSVKLMCVCEACVNLIGLSARMYVVAMELMQNADASLFQPRLHDILLFQ